MKTIALDTTKDTAAWLVHNVQDEPVLVTLPDGNRYVISHADDLQTEVELLRHNQRFLRFLDEAKKDQPRYSFEEVRRTLTAEDEAAELLENDDRFHARVAESGAEYRAGLGISPEEVKRTQGLE